MENFIRKRIDIATCWATNRISAMDTLERYEDSYAIAEEFREWILHIGEKNENLKDSVLNFPKELKKLLYIIWVCLLLLEVKYANKWKIKKKFLT